MAVELKTPFRKRLKICFPAEKRSQRCFSCVFSGLLIAIFKLAVILQCIYMLKVVCSFPHRQVRERTIRSFKTDIL